ncbi:MAG: flagellar biosynthesis protein FliQ [Thermodesulfobacteriota bacterium]|nr:flagellar biosynthesis protein FliQ [Thermodesulfobacteriota bacterium]
MSPDFVTGFVLEAVKITILLAGPVLLFGLVAGLMVSIFQATTQINEMTLVFIPKMIAVAVAILVFFPWMLKIIVGFTQGVFIGIQTCIH